MAQRPDVPLVEKHALADARRHPTDPISRCALVLHDSGSLTLRLLGDRVQVELVPGHDFVDRYPAYGSTAPGHELAVPVFAEHVGVYGACCHVGFTGQDTAQPSGVEKGAGTDDLGFWKAGELLREVGENVDGVGDEEEHGIGRKGLHVLDRGREDAEVAADQVCT